MSSSQGYHLPSRIIASSSTPASPPRQRSSPPSTPPTATNMDSPRLTGHGRKTPPSTPQRFVDHRPVEMARITSPSALSQRSLQPSVYHTPPTQDVATFPNPPQQLHHTSSPLHHPYHSPQPVSRIASPKPLHLVSSHHNLSAGLGITQQHQQQHPQHLLPSAMLAEDDPFDDAKLPLKSPPAIASAFDVTPPVSPADTTGTRDPSSREKKKKRGGVPSGPPPLFKPTLGLLFSLSTKNDKLTLLLPASIFSLLSGLIPPCMTFVLGDAFDAFATYQRTIQSLGFIDEASDSLKHDMLIVAIKLIVLGVLAVVFTTISLAIWVWHGERVAKRLRKAVYVGISRKPLAWFDLGMGKRATTEGGQDAHEGEAQESTENESSGGLMGRFARETDDVRMALSSVAGRILTAACTVIACLVVAFWHSYQLTFVILGAAPLIVAGTIIVEVIVTPVMVLERNLNASAASRAERVTSAIATVKAFNAESIEIKDFVAIAERARTAYNRITLLWGFRAGFVQFLLLGMFVAGFWFGNYLVISGKKTAGDVTIVFWATLLASSNMQMCLPMLNILDKAKVSMAALLETAHEDPGNPSETASASAFPKSPSAIGLVGSPYARDKGHERTMSQATDTDTSRTVSPVTPTFLPIQQEKRGHKRITSLSSNKKPAVRNLRKIHPAKFTGELVLKDVSFHYPSRPAPAPPALDNVSMYLPAKDTTYIVGGSGSGKSTIGSLLLGLYKPESGRIEADEQGIEWLDEAWLRGHIGCVSQGASVIFEGTVHENVALGVVGSTDKKRRPEDVTRHEVIQACRAALFHDFVRDLPDGYDTLLSGEKGASLSGGQRQRLAIARAYIRDPTVLILDEATSALDVVSRHLVHEAVKNWRKNKTTIVITHDLTPITPSDFVYVMRDGRVVEQGYRKELEAVETGWFRHLVDLQAQLPAKEQQEGVVDEFYEAQEVLSIPDVTVTPPRPSRPTFLPRLSSGPGLLLGNEDLGDQIREYNQIRRASRSFVEEQDRRRSVTASPALSSRTLHITNSPAMSYKTPTITTTPPRNDSLPQRPLSFMPRHDDLDLLPALDRHTSAHSGLSVGALERVGLASSARRPANLDKRRTLDARNSWVQLKEVKTHDSTVEATTLEGGQNGPLKPPTMTLVQIFKVMIPEIPNKLGLAAGLALCVGSGVCTPMFSNLFAQLLTSLSAPGSIDLLRIALLLLMIAAIDGFAQWGKYSVLQRVAMGWILKLQKESLQRLLAQEKGWFDQPANSPVNLVSTLVKDAEDARNLIGYVAGNLFTIFAMISLGLIWALVTGWQLTLVGFALGPLFVLSTVASTRILGAYERMNKAEREDCARKFHQAVSNIKAIRSMSLESVFNDKFDKSVAAAYQGGKKSAFFTGFGTGVAFFTIYVAQAIMFYVGAVFIAKGMYTFSQVMQVFVLLIFAITFSSQILQNIPQITKAKFAATDLLRLHHLPSDTAESIGKMTFPVQGCVLFDNVSFAYPTRPNAPVLQNVSFEVKPGECVGIVGPSGSGKSTIAGLLQRLYEPAEGVVRIDGRILPRIDVKYLRDHVAVISQHPSLFDMSIADNITYGSPNSTFEDVVRAAKAAHLHEFIMTLPEQYKTHLGENAGLISGGQAQRLQIARALVRPREILLGDEITSALDAENQELVMRTIREVKSGRTTILVTHKQSVMKMCDRLIVVEDGRIVQVGTYDQLMAQPRGIFVTLASGEE